jgi:trk system potassium uptake protein
MGAFALLVGGGRVGTALAHQLLGRGHRVTVVEHRPDVLTRLETDLPPGVVHRGSGTDPVVLEAAGARAADVVAAVTASDQENLVVTSIARFHFGVPRTVARVVDPRNAWMYGEDMGVDAALDQAELIAELVVAEM